jgi:predicted DNA-binding protein with PD1-like motif
MMYQGGDNHAHSALCRLVGSDLMSRAVSQLCEQAKVAVVVYHTIGSFADVSMVVTHPLGTSSVCSLTLEKEHDMQSNCKTCGSYACE